MKDKRPRGYVHPKDRADQVFLIHVKSRLLVRLYGTVGTGAEVPTFPEAVHGTGSATLLLILEQGK